jgi:F-type H+-transporting ATPase subunit delta
VIPEPAARRYAEAAYLIAREKGAEDAWRDGLRAVAALFSDPAAQAFFANSRIPPEQKQQLVEKAVASAEQYVRNLALLLLSRRRTQLGPQISVAFEEILDAAKGVSHAYVTSAVELTGDEKADVEKKLREITGGDVVLNTSVDESILGGLIVRIGDRLIDGSTRGRLAALKERLAETRS